MIIRFATWNVWNLNRNWKRRFATIRKDLDACAADVVCLQEISIDLVTGRPQSEILAANSPWTASYSKSGTWEGREEGLANLCRWRVRAEQRYLLPNAIDDMQRQLFASAFSLGERRIVVANTHLAFRPNAEPYRVAQVRAALAGLEAFARAQRPDAVVWAGDFNAVPDSPTIAAVLESRLCLRDAFAASPFRRETYTFAGRNPLADPTLVPDRWIDYIFVSPGLEVSSCALLYGGSNGGSTFASDHFGLVADCRLET